MTTWTAFTTLPFEDAAQALSAAMELLEPEPYGVGVFEIEDGSGLWEVAGYFTGKPDLAGLALLAAAHGAAEFAVSEVPDIDWVAHVKRELSPVEAGRFFVYGSHDADKVPEGRVALLIEAAMAFGTGHHGTTQGCLVLLDRLIEAGFAPRRVADIGCGTAVLAMAAAKIWQVPVIASDIDAIAVETAESNLTVNGLAGRVTCIEAAGFDHPALTAGGPYDLVFANILKGPLIDLAPAMAANTESGGAVILSGLLNEQAEEVFGVYAAQGYNLSEQIRIGDWTSAILVKK